MGLCCFQGSTKTLEKNLNIKYILFLNEKCSYFIFSTNTLLSILCSYRNILPFSPLLFGFENHKFMIRRFFETVFKGNTTRHVPLKRKNDQPFPQGMCFSLLSNIHNFPSAVRTTATITRMRIRT